MRIIDISTRKVLFDNDNETNYKLMVVVIPEESFEDVAGSVENWALVGPDNMTFDVASGIMKIIEDTEF